MADPYINAFITYVTTVELESCKDHAYRGISEFPHIFGTNSSKITVKLGMQ